MSESSRVVRDFSEVRGKDARADPSLQPVERETIFRTSADGDVVHVYSEERGVVSRLLGHPELGFERARIHDGAVVSVTGRLPVGVLTVGVVPRESTNHSEMVSQGVFEADGMPETIDADAPEGSA